MDIPDIVDNPTLDSTSIRPVEGGPFSAIIPSMWPQDILARLEEEAKNVSDPNEQPDYRFDEFGFRIEEEDGPEQNSNKLLSVPFTEDEQHRAQWISYLEFSHSKEAELTWDNVDVTVPRTEKLQNMIEAGIPHSLRSEMWMRLSGALRKKLSSETTYNDIIKASNNDSLMTSKQIEKDLLRIFPMNACFSTINSTGVPRLRRILRGIAWLYPDIGYCQGMGVIVSSLLLLLEEENAFWLMATIIEDILPASYYSSTLLGVHADMKVLETLIGNYLTGVDEVLKKHDIELSLISLQWFITLFANNVHMKILLRYVLFYFF